MAPQHQQLISTPLTQLLGIRHPILLAGMNVASGPKLAAAVTNAGGMGVLGGFGYTPEYLQRQIDEIKADLKDKNAPFGVDLLIPKVGEGARRTNYDYTKGQLPQLIDVIIKSGAKLFVCAVGVPPKYAVDKLHKAGIPVMNMIGHPKHAIKAIEAGADIICAQGGEGGGHTGDIPTSVLIPEAVEICKKHNSPLTGKPIQVVAAGAMYNGKSLAAALAFGATGVWVGTRFVASTEAGASKYHKDLVVKATHEDNIRTVIYTGRPLRVFAHDYAKDWEANRQKEIKELTSKGIIPHNHELEQRPEISAKSRPWLMGKIAGALTDVKPAQQIVDEMVAEAVQQLQQASSFVVARAKL